MKILVLGAGSLGSVLGGFLARGGHEVSLLGRRAHVDAINKDGLKIIGAKGENLVKVKAFFNPDDIEDADLLILTTKHKDTKKALESIGHLHSKIITALNFQNGIIKDEPLKNVLGEEKVLCAATIIGATQVSPGVVNLTSMGMTYIGGYEDRQSERAREIVDIFNGAGIETRIHENAQSVLWAKALRYIPNSMMASLTRLTLSKVLSCPGAAELNVIITREIASVARKKGVTLLDFERMPVRTLVEGDFDEAVARVVDYGRNALGGPESEVKPSMLQDIERGRKTEIEETVGYVICEAHRLGIKVPHLETCYRLIKTMDEWL